MVVPHFPSLPRGLAELSKTTPNVHTTHRVSPRANLSPAMLLVRLPTRNSPRKGRARAGNVRATYVLALSRVAIATCSGRTGVGYGTLDRPANVVALPLGWTIVPESTANAACTILAAVHDSSRDGGGGERREPER